VVVGSRPAAGVAAGRPEKRYLRLVLVWCSNQFSMVLDFSYNGVSMVLR
jgi:hypothetical protein